MNRKSFIILGLGCLGIPLIFGKKLQHKRIIYTGVPLDARESLKKYAEKSLSKQGAHRFEWTYTLDGEAQVTAYRYA